MRTPALEHLMGAYFHQDWTLSGDTHMSVVDQFVQDEPAMAAGLPLEIHQVLSETPDDDELESLLDRMGCEVYPQPRELGYRRWLNAIADRAREQVQR